MIQFHIDITRHVSTRNSTQTNKQVYNKKAADWTEITGSQERSACRVTTIWLENGGSTTSRAQ